LDTAAQLEHVVVVGMVDTFGNPAIWNTEVWGIAVVGDAGSLRRFPPASDLKLVLAITDRSQKRIFAEDLASRGYEFANVVHPSAIISPRASMGFGCIINAGVVVENGSQIGNHIIIHAGCTIEHDNIIGDFVNLGPGVATAGRVRIGTGATVYTGATLVPDVTVNEDAVVGAGAVVLGEVPSGATVVGVPAKPLLPRAGT
jgi:acetyltransferase EpsM